MIYFDYFFHILHLCVIFFNLFAWLFEATRKLHFILVNITLASWCVGGFFYGFGYCFLTDWHWQLKKKLGENYLPHSYIDYLLQNVFALKLSFEYIDNAVASLFFLVYIIAWILFFKNKEIKKN